VKIQVGHICPELCKVLWDVLDRTVHDTGCIINLPYAVIFSTDKPTVYIQVEQ